MTQGKLLVGNPRPLLNSGMTQIKTAGQSIAIASAGIDSIARLGVRAIRAVRASP
jgi:hypothetical protein